MAHAETGDARTIRSLRAARSVFFRQPGPRLLAGQWLVFLALRLYAGAPGPGDLAIAGAVALWWPLQEWAAHRWILHLKPRWVFGVRVDPLFARAHRAHHREPWRVGYIFLPLRVLLPLMPIHAAAWWYLSPTPALALTGMLAFGGAALIYEWIHFLTHTAHAPRTAYFRAVRRGHRYHHYKNERYWFAFTGPRLDTLLGTDPDPRAVPISHTARDPDPGP